MFLFDAIALYILRVETATQEHSPPYVRLPNACQIEAEVVVGAKVIEVIEPGPKYIEGAVFGQAQMFVFRRSIPET